MKLSEHWLREWVNPDINCQALCHQLTMAGLEVDSCHPVAGEFSGVIIGKIIEAEQHPNADKLRVCQIEVGDGLPLQIICGAPNARQGILVCVAQIGAVLPGDFKIKKAKLRGVESQGMLCSEAELGLAEEADGIMELPQDAPIGQDIRQYLQLDDQAIEIDLTANRGDCFSLRGVSREVGVINRLPVNTPEIKPLNNAHDQHMPVEIKASDGCPKYGCRIIKNINMQAQTPLWMQQRLWRSGIRAISPVVDVTNYVMLSLGQPMHAFDVANISDKIIVRYSKPNETLTLLDGQEVKCLPKTLMIADQEGPIALAGIMGGQSTAVTDQTQDILLESAFFTPLAIMGKPRQYGLHTDASVRFERGVDPQITEQALDYAAQLLADIAGGQVGPIHVESDQRTLPKSYQITLRFERLTAYLGVEIDHADVIDILNRLGLSTKQIGVGVEVQVPSYRFDLTQEADLIEEVARIYGYDNIARELPATTMQPEQYCETTLCASRLRQLYRDRGYLEAMTYSFIDPKWHQALFGDQAAKALLNPIASDMSIMRTSLLPGLLKVAQHNLSHQQRQLRLFETGTCFLYQDDKITERQKMALLLTGLRDSSVLHGADNKVDFFDLKADFLALADLYGFQHDDIEINTDDLPNYLHPGRSGRIMTKSQIIGEIGQLHPTTAKALDIRQPIWLLEIDLAFMGDMVLPKAAPISKYPQVKRDLALEVDQTVSAQQIKDVIKEYAGSDLQTVEIFDVYQGEHLADDQKSIAFTLIFQGLSYTLEEAAVQQAIDSVLNALSQKLGAKLRA